MNPSRPPSLYRTRVVLLRRVFGWSCLALVIWLLGLVGLSEMRRSNMRHALADIDAQAATQMLQARQASEKAAAIGEPAVSICVRERALAAFNMNASALLSRRDEYVRADFGSVIRQAFVAMPPMQTAHLAAYDVPRWQHQCQTERAQLTS